VRARVGGVNTTSLIGDAFRKAKYEIVAAKKEATKARAGKKLVLSVVERIPSPQPPSFLPALTFRFQFFRRHRISCQQSWRAAVN